jgi:hypothetical protein
LAQPIDPTFLSFITVSSPLSLPSFNMIYILIVYIVTFRY